jgi:hypothetical protein
VWEDACIEGLVEVIEDKVMLTGLGKAALVRSGAVE